MINQSCWKGQSTEGEKENKMTRRSIIEYFCIIKKFIIIFKKYNQLVKVLDIISPSGGKYKD